MCRLLVGMLLMLGDSALGQQYPFVPVATAPKNIEHIFEDRSGRLWVSTNNDILCFDGSRFYSLRRYGLPPIDTFDLTEDNEGGIWSASDAALYRFHEGHLERVLKGSVVSVAPGVLLPAL